MEFEQLKQSIDRSANKKAFVAPELLKLLGFDPVGAIRRAMRREIVYQFLIACLFLSLYWIPFWENELQRSLYLICMFITAMMTMGYICKLSRFLLTKSPIDYTVNTRQFLDEFLSQVKITIAGYESFVISGCFLLPISMFALLADAKTFDKWIHLRLNNLEFAGLVAGYLVIVAFVVLTTKSWTQWLYGRRIGQLEELVQQLNDKPAAE